MSGRTLLDLLGTGQLPLEAERKFIEFCIWQQARPALAHGLEAVGMSDRAADARHARSLAELHSVARQAAHAARSANLPVLALGAVQGMASDVAQLAAAAATEDGDAAGVSFHAARLAGWALWARNDFQAGMFKTSAENIAFGEQLQTLLKLVGAV